MTIFYIFLTILFAYFFLVFFVARFFVPYLGFKKDMPRQDLPAEVMQKISEMENQAADQKAYLQLAYDFIIHKWTGGRFNVIFNFPKLFRNDIGKIWNQTGYAHCTTKNFILYTLLANSKYFKVDDIKIRHTFWNMVVHQYLKVKLGNRWVDVDPAAASIGNYPIGTHGWFFR
ncbi:MAG: hypothetical protein AAB871_02540 [Patescibacteria group bacterium]